MCCLEEPRAPITSWSVGLFSRHLVVLLPLRRIAAPLTGTSGRAARAPAWGAASRRTSPMCPVLIPLGKGIHPRLGHRHRLRQGDGPRRVWRQGHPPRRPRHRKPFPVNRAPAGDGDGRVVPPQLPSGLFSCRDASLSRLTSRAGRAREGGRSCRGGWLLPSFPPRGGKRFFCRPGP